MRRQFKNQSYKGLFTWWNIVEEVGTYIREHGLDISIKKADTLVSA
ncbi:hypothetical protein KKA50_01305 [Patescibacteria group bacterium]|nr:hypothetical protein [Patescibacteria group bacterium]